MNERLTENEKRLEECLGECYDWFDDINNILTKYLRPNTDMECDANWAVSELLGIMDHPQFFDMKNRKDQVLLSLGRKSVADRLRCD
jgi:hypothetical protein